MSRLKSYPASSAILIIARVSFGKQLWATSPKEVTTVWVRSTSNEYTVCSTARRAAAYVPLTSDVPLADVIFADLRRRRVVG